MASRIAYLFGTMGRLGRGLFKRVQLKTKILSSGFYEIEPFFLESFPEITLDEAIVLFELAKKTNENIVEIGSFCGASTITLAEGSIRGNNKEVTAIDPHSEMQVKQSRYEAVSIIYHDTKKIFEKNISKIKAYNLIKPIYKKSQDVPWKKPIGLLFIDGEHTYDGVKRDFINFGKFVILQGYVIFHDYGTEKGITKFIDESVFTNKDFEFFQRANRLMVFRKKK